MTGLAFNNQRVQALRRLLGRRSARRDEARFVVEGPVLVAEAVRAGWRLEAQFLPAGSDAAIAGAGEAVELADGVFERVGSTETPRPPMAIAPITGSPMVADLEAASFVLVLDGIADPGNLGTIMRSAEASGADLVVLTPGSTDPYGPKAVRASAGALFHVPVLVATCDEVRQAGLRLLGTSSHRSTGRTVRAHDNVDWSGRIAIVMGSEAVGLPGQWTDEHGPIDEWVAIQHVGRSESLNVAMAATVLVFEAARGRR
ncbi:MAG: RNA methyltransferase [Acidimicrobiia bacterium]|nr:RNA methyltransferase [Acidimicrobiia bacterium]